MVVLTSLLVFLAAAMATFATSLAAFRLAGRALNPRRSPRARAALAFAAALAALCAPGAAAAGFAGIAAISFWSQTLAGGQ